MATIHWFKNDLRLEDNLALKVALEHPSGVLPLYIHSPKEETHWALGGASSWWLHHALRDLEENLAKKGLKLIIRKGPVLEVLSQLMDETKADVLTFNRSYEPQWRRKEELIQQTLKPKGVDVLSFNSTLLFDPSTIFNKSGQAFRVFTYFWKHCRPLLWEDSLQMPKKPWKSIKEEVSSDAIESLELLPKINWAHQFDSVWEATRAGAQKKLTYFISHGLSSYEKYRDYPAHKEATSSLSPYLHFGQIGPRELVLAIKSSPFNGTASAEKFLSELGWREFAHYLLFHFPRTPDEPLYSIYREFPWREDPHFLRSWQKGQSGYPIVDAGMRELWQTGILHNRVRMLAASVLVKQFLQPWQAGARWFWDTLVDADLASNTLGWQWCAGCGADAAPYFRVFNPVLQGEKFDPMGDYVRRFVPELKELPNKWIHRPWEAPGSVLQAAGIVLGKDYPFPLVLPDEGRRRALAAYEHFKTLK